MPSKLKPTAVRIPDEMKPRIDKHAERENLPSRHRAVLDLLAIALEQVEALWSKPRAIKTNLRIPGNKPGHAILARAEKQAAHLAKPKLPNVQSGPVRAKPGERLKAK